MNAYWYCTISKVIGIGGFCYLVVNDSPWLGLICLLFIATMDEELKNGK